MAVCSMFPLGHPGLLLEAKFFPVLSLSGGDRKALLGQAEGRLSSVDKQDHHYHYGLRGSPPLSPAFCASGRK